MVYKQNLHTHTTFCDGKNTVEEMVLEAISKGFDSLGFSGHSYMSFAEEYSMSLSSEKEYKKEVIRVQEKYKDKIKIFLGLEYELFSNVPITDYQYVIGSCHYLKKDGQIIGFDRDQQTVANIIKEHFNGDGMEYAKCYYQTLATLPQYGKFDIIGHFDLITKHADNIEFFDQNSKKYQSYALEAVNSLADKIDFFEVNTGAIARGYRKNTPYPATFILKELKRRGVGAVISSDCHNKCMLDCYFNQSEELLRQIGFKELYVLTEEGFTATKL